MAGSLFSYVYDKTTLDGSSTPVTMVQFLAPSTLKITLHRILISMRGTTPATQPKKFDLVRQTSAGVGGTSIADADFSNLTPGDAHTLQTTGLNDSAGWTTEPATTTPGLFAFSLQEQVTFAFVPQTPTGTYVLAPGDRIALRNHFAALAVIATFVFEE